MTSCKSKSYKLSTEFWLNYHLPQALVSSRMCMILFWSPPPLPPRSLLQPAKTVCPLWASSYLGTTLHPKPTKDETQCPPQHHKGQSSNPHVICITYWKPNTTIILGVDGKQNRDFSSLKKNLNVVHLLLQIYFL